jgi:hypothetical protein
MSNEATFHAAFEGASVTIKIDYDAFHKAPGGMEWLKAKWEGQRTMKIVPQYIAWMHTVMCQVAQRVNQKIGYGYEPPRPGLPPLVFVYYPDGHYEQVQPPIQRR